MKPPIPIGGDCPAAPTPRCPTHPHAGWGAAASNRSFLSSMCLRRTCGMSLARKNEGADKYDKYLGQHEKEDDQPPMTRPVHDKMLFRWRRIPKPETASEKGNTPPRKIVTRNMWGCPCPLSYQNTEENAKRQRPFSRKPNHPRIPAKTLRARWECSHRLAPESKRYPPLRVVVDFSESLPLLFKGSPFPSPTVASGAGIQRT